jgi:hypothetical protein
MVLSSTDALERFAARHGLSLDLLQGRPIPDNTVYRDRLDPYSVRLGASSSSIPSESGDQAVYDGTVQAVRIHRLYRFSNSLVQLAHALHAAHHLGAAAVQLPGAWYLKRGITALTDSLVLANGARYFQRQLHTLEGLYFYGHTLAPACPGRPSLRELLLPIRPALTLAIDEPPLPDDHIVLHVRSGDLFGPDPHPAYFQPPLALYLRALQEQAWGHAHVVFEDYGNPVVQGLVAWCADQRLPLTLHSWGLQRDLALLLRAHTLVVGRGTFMPGVVALSRHAREVHSYGPFDEGGAWGLTHVRNVIYKDRDGAYLRVVRPWRHSPRQRELMLSFPGTQFDTRVSS